MYDKILILDAGSQFTQLIAKNIRAAHVFCEIHPYAVSIDFIKKFDPKGIILSGSYSSVLDQDAQYVAQEIFTLGIPILGICYGMQTMAKQLGGIVTKATIREFGLAHINIIEPNILSSVFSASFEVWMSHGDQVTKLPEGFSAIASSQSCAIAIMADSSRNLYAVQFHPEVTHTPQGFAMLSNFVINICNARPNWLIDEDYIEQAIKKIKQTVGGNKVLLALSGGVDSAVAAALIYKAIGGQLTCVFVDNGLLRANEAVLVMQMLNLHIGAHVIHIDASLKFLAKLTGISDPESKRKIIGATFIDVFQAQANKLSGVNWLAQGTIYPDVIESSTSTANPSSEHKKHPIKSHHNVAGLPEIMHLRLLEPLRSLFKDEVRTLGIALGLPTEMIYRHPFPGPGLAVRILGEIKSKYLKLLSAADAIFIHELRTTIDEATHKTWYELTSQAFAVFLPIKSVGVMGDGRTYEYVIALRAVETQDFMSANWAHLPYKLLGRISNRIINEVPGINRVVYDISGKPPATIEWE